MKQFGGPAAFIDRSDINTDEIIPAKYLTEITKKALAPHLLEDLYLEGQKFDPHSQELQEAKVLITRSNFGCGSSREHAPSAIKASGVSCVIGKSFARIFFRNAINTGLPLLECAEAVDSIRQGDTVEVDLATGTITNLSSVKTFKAKPYPDFMMEIINAGGLIEHTRNKSAGTK